MTEPDDSTGSGNTAGGPHHTLLRIGLRVGGWPTSHPAADRVPHVSFLRRGSLWRHNVCGRQLR